jgi:hypothetical protein
VKSISCEDTHSASSGTVSVAEALFLVGCDSVSLGVYIRIFSKQHDASLQGLAV